jgi:hypothetical protein
MRPHPKLAITSATVIIGAAGAIGVANANGNNVSFARAVRHTGHVRFVAHVRRQSLRLPKATTAIVAGVYRTTPIPYLFARRPHEPLPPAVVRFVAAAPPSSAATPGQWLALRTCESDDNYSENSGNGYYGAYQFAASTWWGLGFSGLPSAASAAVQDAAAAKLQRLDGWSAWPVCSQVVGL